MPRPSPAFWARFHLILTIVWFVMMPVAILTGWIYLIPFVSVISIYANFGTHFGAYQGSRAEVKADEE